MTLVRLLIAAGIARSTVSQDAISLRRRAHWHHSALARIDDESSVMRERQPHVVCRRMGCPDHHGSLFVLETESSTPGPNPSPVVSTKTTVFKRPPPPNTPPTSSPSLVPEIQPDTPSPSPVGSPVAEPTGSTVPPPTSSPSLVPEIKPNTPSPSPVGPPETEPTGPSVPPPFTTLSPTGSTIDQTGQPTTYEPGVFTDGARSSDGLIILSNGLSAKPIAHSGDYVQFADGGVSAERFHKLPDAAGVFNVKDGGWLYVSNAENYDPGPAPTQGGVGVLEFGSNGEVVGYRKISGTFENCGGGMTPWGSWISGEEAKNGHVVQFDPYGIEPPRNTAMGDLGFYESFAYDDGTEIPTFYTTRDHEDGLITRFTPDQEGYACYVQSDSYKRWCTLDNGTIDYLYLHPDGSIEWITDLDLAKKNSKEYHKNCEGILVKDGILYFTAKVDKLLFTVDLRTLKYASTSTVSAGFEEQPDQIVRIPGDVSGSIYFCEDGGYHPGLHIRTESGQVYTILHADKDQFNNVDETTGIAFSPDAMHLYVSFQHVGIIYDVTREDKLSFSDTPTTMIE